MGLGRSTWMGAGWGRMQDGRIRTDAEEVVGMGVKACPTISQNRCLQPPEDGPPI